MSKRLIGIFIIVIGLVALIGAVYFIFFDDVFSQPETAPPAEEAVLPPAPAANSISPGPSRPSTVIEVEPPSPAEVKQADLKRLAAAFSERFGSYSNQSDYGNIKDLRLFMTARMRQWADNFIAESRINRGETGIYYGIATKALAQEINYLDDDSGQAQILVKTQRQESTGAISNATTFYQNILITFIKENGAWKVDSANWLDK